MRNCIVGGRELSVESGSLEVQDYIMSEKFGMDWREYDSKRVTFLLEVASAYSEKEKRDLAKQKQQSKYGRNNKNNY